MHFCLYLPLLLGIYDFYLQYGGSLHRASLVCMGCLRISFCPTLVMEVAHSDVNITASNSFSTYVTNYSLISAGNTRFLEKLL